MRQALRRGRRGVAVGREVGTGQEGRLAVREGEGADSRSRCYVRTIWGPCSKCKSLCFKGLDDSDAGSLGGTL